MQFANNSSCFTVTDRILIFAQSQAVSNEIGEFWVSDEFLKISFIRTDPVRRSKGVLPQCGLTSGVSSRRIALVVFQVIATCEGDQDAIHVAMNMPVNDEYTTQSEKYKSASFWRGGLFSDKEEFDYCEKSDCLLYLYQMPRDQVQL